MFARLTCYHSLSRGNPGVLSLQYIPNNRLSIRYHLVINCYQNFALFLHKPWLGKRLRCWAGRKKCYHYPSSRFRFGRGSPGRFRLPGGASKGHSRSKPTFRVPPGRRDCRPLLR